MNALDFFSDIAERLVDLLKPEEDLRDEQWLALKDQYNTRSDFEEDLENKLHSNLVDPVVQEVLISGVSFDVVDGDTSLYWPLHRVYVIDASGEDISVFMPSFDNRSTSNQYFDISVNASLVSFIRIDDTNNFAEISGNGTDISGNGTVSLNEKYATVTIFTGDDEWLILQSGGDVSGGGSTPDVDVYNETPAGTIDGSNQVFTTSNDFKNGSQRLYVNGVRQKESVDYNVTASDEIEFTDTTPEPGNTLTIDYIIA